MTTTPLPPWKFERVIDGIPCVPTVEAEHNMQAYATQARADLEAENKRLREAIQKQLDPSWECNSNHPALYAALEKQP